LVWGFGWGGCLGLGLGGVGGLWVVWVLVLVLLCPQRGVITFELGEPRCQPFDEARKNQPVKQLDRYKG